MDQKSGKKPVNVNSETEEAENEMKKKTSKTVKSIAAVGFAVGGISAVQNFEAYAAEEENALEPEDSNSDGSDSNGGGSGSDGASNDGGTGESNGGSNDSGNGESGDNSQNESGETNQSDSFSGEQEGTNSTGNSNNTSDGQVETNSTENSGNAGSQDDAVGGTNDTQGQPANDAVVKDASKDSTETGPAAESTEVTSTEANASTSDTTEETTGPVTTITTETTTKDSLNDDGTTTTTTTVTTTTEKSDGTVTSDTKTSTETKETIYEELPDKDAVGPGYKTEYYKSEEDQDVADQEIEKQEYDNLAADKDGQNRHKTGTEYYYLADDGVTKIPVTNSIDQVENKEIAVDVAYYKPVYDENGNKIGETNITPKEFAEIQKNGGNVFAKNEYYYHGSKIYEATYNDWLTKHANAGETYKDESGKTLSKADYDATNANKTATLAVYAVEYTDESGEKHTEEFPSEKARQDFVNNNKLSGEYYYIDKNEDGTKERVLVSEDVNNANKYTVTVTSADGTKTPMQFESYEKYKAYLASEQWNLTDDTKASTTTRHFYETVENRDGVETKVKKYLTSEEEEEFNKNGTLPTGAVAYTEYSVTYHVYKNGELQKVTYQYRDQDEYFAERKADAEKNVIKESKSESKYYYFDKEGNKNQISKDELTNYEFEKENVTDYSGEYQYTVKFTNNQNEVKTVYFKNKTDYQNFVNQHNIKTDGGETVRYYFETDKDGNIVKDEKNQPKKHYLSTEDEEKLKNNTFKDNVIYTATYVTTVTKNGEKPSDSEITKTYTSYEDFIAEYGNDSDQNAISETVVYLDKTGNEVTLTDEQKTAYENGDHSIAYDVEHTASFYVWDLVNKCAIKAEPVIYHDSDSPEVKKEAINKINAAKLVTDKYNDGTTKKYYFDDHGKKTVISEDELTKISNNQLVKTVYTVNGKVVDKSTYEATFANTKEDKKTFYYINNGKDADGKDVLVQVNSDQVLINTEIGDDGKTVFSLKDVKDDSGNPVIINESSALYDELKTKYKTASGVVNKYYITGTKEKNGQTETVTVEFTGNTKIEEGQTVDGYTLLKDKDGRYYLSSQSGEKIFVDGVSTYTSDTVSSLHVLDPSSSTESIPADSTIQNATLHFLNEHSITSNFDIYAEDFEANQHIDGNICVNTINKTSKNVSELHASGRTDVKGLDKYSIIIDSQGVNFSVVDNGTKIFSNEGTTATNLETFYLLDENGNRLKDQNGKDIKNENDSSEIITVKGNDASTVKENIAKEIENKYKDKETVERVKKEMNISENLKKIADAGQSLIEATKGEVSKWKDTIESILSKEDGGTGKRTLDDKDVLLLNVKDSDLNKNTSDTNSFVYALGKLLSYIGVDRDTRVIVNVSTEGKTSKDTINVDSSIIKPVSSDVYGHKDTNAADGSNNCATDSYNATAARVIWNFGNFNGTVSLNSGPSQGNFIVANGTLKLAGGSLDGGMIAKNIAINAEAHQSRVPKLPVETVEKGFIIPNIERANGLSTKAEHFITDHTDTFYTIYQDQQSETSITKEIDKKVTKLVKSYTTKPRSIEEEGVSNKVRTLYSDSLTFNSKDAKPIQEESITVKTEKREIYNASLSMDQIEKKSVYDGVESRPVKKKVLVENHFITLAKKVFKPVLNESYDKKVETIPETPDKPDTPDTPHDDHDTPDTPHDDHDTPDTPKDLHDKPDTPEVLGASRPKEQAVLGASRPKVLGVTRAAKTGDARNMARNGFVAAAGAIVLAVWGAIKALVGRKHRK